jgi:hypothetical protein
MSRMYYASLAMAMKRLNCEQRSESFRSAVTKFSSIAVRDVVNWRERRQLSSAVSAGTIGAMRNNSRDFGQLKLSSSFFRL